MPTETAARLLRLLSLLQTPREWPGSELAERLAVSPRTVRRDVDRLRDLGYPVEASMGATGGYRLVAGSAMPPLLVDDDEAVAIAVGLSTAARQAVEGMAEAALRALAKLEQVLPARLRYRVGTLRAATVPMTALAGEAPVEPAVLTVLAAAIANRERVRFRYRDESRLLEPHRLVAAGHRWYLLGHDEQRADWRVFRVDRLTDPTATGARFTPREIPGGDPARYVRERLLTLLPTHRAQVTVHAPAADLATAFAPPAELTALDQHTTRVHTAPDTLDWLAFRLLGLGRAFVVHEPVELVEHLRTLAVRIEHAVGPSPTPTETGKVKR
jgi:predicted DNA-binding transcriptional regulator YafY